MQDVNTNHTKLQHFKDKKNVVKITTFFKGLLHTTFTLASTFHNTADNVNTKRD